MEQWVLSFTFPTISYLLQSLLPFRPALASNTNIFASSTEELLGSPILTTFNQHQQLAVLLLMIHGDKSVLQVDSLICLFNSNT
jgi:hypothetical protein